IWREVLKRHRCRGAVLAVQLGRCITGDNIGRLFDDAFSVGSRCKVRSIDEFAVAVSGVAPAIRLGPAMLRRSHVDEGPFLKGSALLMVPESSLPRTAEMITVEIARECLAGTQVHDGGLSRVGGVVQLVPVAALGNLLEALLGVLEVTRPDERKS